MEPGAQGVIHTQQLNGIMSHVTIGCVDSGSRVGVPYKGAVYDVVGVSGKVTQQEVTSCALQR